MDEQQKSLNENVLTEGDDERNILQTVMEYFFTYVRPYLWLYPLGVVLFLSAGFVYLQTATPKYRSTCQLYVSNNELRVLRVEGVQDPTTYGMAGRLFLNTQLSLITSKEILTAAYEAVPAVKADTSLCSVPQATLGKNTNLVDITVESRNAEVAARLANSVASSYIDFMTRRRVKITNVGVELLQDKLREIQSKREKAMEEITQFKNKNGIFDWEHSYASYSASVEKLNDKLFELELDKEEILLSIREVTANEAIAEIMLPYLMPEEQITHVTALQDMLLEHEMKKPELLTQYNEGHQVIQIHNKVGEMIKKASENEMKRTLKGAELRIQRIDKQSERLREQIKEIEAKMSHLDQLAGEYKMRETAYASLDRTCNMLVNRINEIEIADSTTKSDEYSIFVVTPAVKPLKPFYPVAKRVMLMMLVSGLGLAVAISFILVSINNKVTDIEQVSQAFGGALPVFGSVPRFEDEEEKLLQSSGEDPIDEAFRDLRISLNLSMNTRDAKVLAISSTIPSEGKSFVTSNLARSFARDGKKTLLIDMDLRKPREHKMLKSFLEPGAEKRGVVNVLVGDCKLADVVNHLDKLNLDVVLAGPIPPNPSELLGSERMKSLLEEAKQNYDMIFIDTPPMLPVTDTMIIASLKIPLLVVACMFRVTKPLVFILRDKLKQLNIKPCGFIANNIELPKASYGYRKGGYGGYGEYGYGYGKYGYGYGKYGYGYGKYGYGYGKYGYGYGKDQNDEQEQEEESNQQDAKEPQDKQ